MADYFQLGQEFQSPLLANLLSEAIAGQSSGKGEKQGFLDKVYAPSTSQGSYVNKSKIKGDKMSTQIKPEDKVDPYALKESGRYGGGEHKTKTVLGESDIDNLVKNLMKDQNLTEEAARKQLESKGIKVGGTFEGTQTSSSSPIFENYHQELYGRDAQRVSSEIEAGVIRGEHVNYGNNQYDFGESFVDTNKNQRWDEGEKFFDYDTGGKQFTQEGYQTVGKQKYPYQFAYMPPEELANFADADVAFEEEGYGPALGTSPLGQVFKEGIYLSGEQNKPVFLTGDPEKDKVLSENLSWITQDESEKGRGFVPWDKLQEHLGEEEYANLLAQSLEGKYGGIDPSMKRQWESEGKVDLEDLIYGGQFTPHASIGGALGEAVPISENILRGIDLNRRQKAQYLDLLESKYLKQYEKNINK
jgi:hypothetical protein